MEHFFRQIGKQRTKEGPNELQVEEQEEEAELKQELLVNFHQ